MALYMPLTGVDPTDPVPNEFVEVRVAVGDAGAAAGLRRVLILAPSIASGSITQDTQVVGPVADEAEVVALTGDGSPAHLLWAGYKEQSAATGVWLCCPTRSAGVAASAAITVSGTPTGQGTLEVAVGGQPAYYTYGVSDTATTIAAGIKDAINALRRCPVTASNAAGVLTLTAKCAGLGGNTVRFRARLITVGTGVTLSNTADTPLAGGTVAENHTAALATLAGQRFDLLLCATDATAEIAKIKAQVDTMALPSTGMRQFAVFGLALTPTAAGTLAQTHNWHRATFANQEESPEPAYVLAGKVGGAIAANRFASPKYNFNKFGSKAGQVFTAKRPVNDSAIPTVPELRTMLAQGVTPIGVLSSGQVVIVRHVTGRSHNGALVPDFRVRDAHRVFCADDFGDALAAAVASKPWEDVTEDVPSNAQQPGAEFATPRRAATVAEQVIGRFRDAGLIDPSRYAEMIDGVQAGTDPQNPGRLNVRAPFYAVRLLHQTALLVTEQSPNS